MEATFNLGESGENGCTYVLTDDAGNSFALFIRIGIDADGLEAELLSLPTHGSRPPGETL